MGTVTYALCHQAFPPSTAPSPSPSLPFSLPSIHPLLNSVMIHSFIQPLSDSLVPRGSAFLKVCSTEEHLFGAFISLM